MQNSVSGEGSRTGDKESKPISKEQASTISDGLYYYEQVEKWIPLYILIICTQQTILIYKLFAGTKS